MLQRVTYICCAQWPCVAWLAIALAAVPAAFAQESAPASEVAPEDTEAPAEPAEAAEPAADSTAPAPAPSDDIEVIRIRGSALTDIDTEVPASATQFDAEAVQALGAQNISDLAKVTPNVEIRTAGSTTATFFIRGVGLSDFNANAGGAVAVYRDGVALNSPALQLGQLFDVENVEVLRGPQASGEGRNSSAGSIKIASRRPVGDLSAFLNSSYGNLNYMKFEGGVEFPIVEENLAGRLSFTTTSRDGWGQNGCGGLPPLAEREPLPFPPIVQPQGGYCGEGQTGPAPPHSNASDRIAAGLPSAVNDLGNWAARGMFRYQPQGSDMDWLLTARGGHTDQLSTLGQAVGSFWSFSDGQSSYGTGLTSTAAGSYRDPDVTEMCLAAGYNTANCNRPRTSGLPVPVGAPGYGPEVLGPVIARQGDIRPRRGDYDRVGQTRLDTWGTTLTGDVPVGPVRLGVTSSYDTYDRFRDEDNDFTSDVVFENQTEDTAWQYFQDVRVDGELEDRPLRWEVGGYYLMEKLASDATLYLLSNTDLNEYTQDLWSFAVYSGFAWDFLDDFTLEGGVRYNWEKKAFASVYRKPTREFPIEQEEIWQAPTGTIGLTYRLREDTSVYWKYSRGWKGGQFNATPQINRIAGTDTAIPPTPAQPETIDAWEIGLKGNWADGRLGFSTALFYYKYFDYQVFIIRDNELNFPIVEIINANEAQVYGAELEARAEPLALDFVAGVVPDSLENLRLGASFSWLESEFLNFTEEVTRRRPTNNPENPLENLLVPVTIDHSGNQLINSPRFKLALNAEWTFELGRFGSLTPRYDGAWSFDIFFDANEGRGSPNINNEFVFPEYAIGQPAFWLHNLALTYTLPMGNVEISGWVRNLTDEVYKSYAFDVSSAFGQTVNFFGEPRTFGGTLKLYW